VPAATDPEFLFEARLRGWPPLSSAGWGLIPTFLLYVFMFFGASGYRMTAWRWTEGWLFLGVTPLLIPLAAVVAFLLWLTHWRSRTLHVSSDELLIRVGAFRRTTYVWERTDSTHAKIRPKGVVVILGLKCETTPPLSGCYATHIDLLGLERVQGEELVGLLNAGREPRE
jgi:hypothetical protein